MNLEAMAADFLALQDDIEGARQKLAEVEPEYYKRKRYYDSLVTKRDRLGDRMREIIEESRRNY